MIDLMQQLIEAAGAIEPPTEEKDRQGGGDMPQLQRAADKRAQDLDRAAGILKEYQEHTAAANGHIVEIAKGIKAGEDIHILFLKALKALELVTNNKMLESAAADYLAIYGAGFGTSSLLKIELEQTQQRLNKLEQAAADETISSGERDRIAGAIQRHKARIERISKQIV
ncbi:hypothetical protein IJ556_05860 [bacterium]|nr:hypothetical protein [bacterium]